MPLKKPSRSTAVGRFVSLNVTSLEDRTTPTATLLTTQFGGTQALPSDALIIGSSSEARYILFQSAAKNVVEDMQFTVAGSTNLYWQDTNTNERHLVSAEHSSGGLQAAGVVPTVVGGPANAVISADGSTVAFLSTRNATFMDPIGTGSTPGFILDAGDTSADVFIWRADVARVGEPVAGDFVFLASREGNMSPIAVGNTSSASNPALSEDGTIVTYVSRRDANVIDPAVMDNGDFSPDLFGTVIGALGVTFTPGMPPAPGMYTYTQTYTTGCVTQYPNATSGVQESFGKTAGFLQVDPLGRYMSGDGQSYAIVSNLSPDKINITYSPSVPGAVDIYHLRFGLGLGAPTINLVTSQPGLTGTTAGVQSISAIIPRDAPSQVIFAATHTADSTPLVSGYLNQNGGGADLFVRNITGTTLGPTFLVTASDGSFNVGANGTLDTAIGSYSGSPDGTRIYFTSAGTNMDPTVSDTNGVFDVFVRTLSSNTTTALSTVAGAALTGNGASTQPRPSDDGLVAAFVSVATNLFGAGVADRNGGTDVFARDLMTGRLALVSSTATGLSTGNGKSFYPVVGGVRTNAQVYFTSASTDLDPSFVVPPGTTQGYTETGLPFRGTLGRRIAISGGSNGFAALGTFDADGSLSTGTPFTPFLGFTGELRVASADITGDGFEDLIVGAGPGGGPRIKVIDGATGTTVYDFFVFESTFTGGVYVAGADFNGDGRADLVIGAGEGGGPRVLILDGQTKSVVANIFVYESTFRGGVRVATGDVNGDNQPDLVTSAGEGGGPRVTVIDGVNLAADVRIADFFAFESTLRNGAFVGAGDLNGDGLADVVAGAGPGGAPRVIAFDAAKLNNPILGQFDELFDFFAYPEASRDGVRVTVRDASGDAIPDLVTGIGGGGPQIKVFSSGQRTDPLSPSTLQSFFAFNDPTGQFGAWVG